MKSFYETAGCHDKRDWRMIKYFNWGREVLCTHVCARILPEEFIQIQLNSIIIAVVLESTVWCFLKVSLINSTCSPFQSLLHYSWVLSNSQSHRKTLQKLFFPLFTLSWSRTSQFLHFLINCPRRFHKVKGSVEWKLFIAPAADYDWHFCINFQVIALFRDAKWVQSFPCLFVAYYAFEVRLGESMHVTAFDSL